MSKQNIDKIRNELLTEQKLKEESERKERIKKNSKNVKDFFYYFIIYPLISIVLGLGVFTIYILNKNNIYFSLFIAVYCSIIINMVFISKDGE